MAVNYEKLGELIDGYGGISADDLHALHHVPDTRDDEIASLREANKRLREAEDDFQMRYRARCDEQTKKLDVEREQLKEENNRLRAALAEVELVLIGLRDGFSVTTLSGAHGCDDLLGGSRT